MGNYANEYMCRTYGCNENNYNIYNMRVSSELKLKFNYNVYTNMSC